MRRWLVAFTLSVLLVGCTTQAEEPQQLSRHPRRRPRASCRRACRPKATGRRLTGCRHPPNRSRPRRRPPRSPAASCRSAAPEGVVVDAATRTVAVAKRDPDELVLLNADTGEVGNGSPTARLRATPSTGRPGRSRPRSGGERQRACSAWNCPAGGPLPQILTGTVPHDAAQAANGTVFVANEHGGTVAVLRGHEIVKVFTDSVQPAGLAPVGRRRWA